MSGTDIEFALPTGPALGGFGEYSAVAAPRTAPETPVVTPCSLIADPFAEETTGAAKPKKGGENKDYVHVRVQQRNGKKSLTTVQGLPEAFDYKKILKALKKGESLFDGQTHRL
jgi:hypothetical protein